MARKTHPPLTVDLLRDPVHFLALGFGSGLSPYAPGTFGTLVALPIAVALMLMPPVPAIAAVVVFIIGGIWLCGESARRLNCHDHPGIVWDEIAAFALLSLVLPWGLAWLFLAFVLFRFFDIVKPWPIRDLDHRLGGGLGIMLDDLMAAVYSALVIKLIEYLTTKI
jgi:phosphatidylglycerophosphatase A